MRTPNNSLASAAEGALSIIDEADDEGKLIDKRLLTTTDSDRCRDLSGLVALLRLCGIVTSCHTGPFARRLNVLLQAICVVLVCAYIATVIYIIAADRFAWIPIGFTTWSIHSLAIYMLLSRSMAKNSGLLNVLKVIAEPEPEEIIDTTSVCTQTIKGIAIKSAVATVCLAVVNIVISFLNFDAVMSVIKFPKSAYYFVLVLEILVTYIFSFCYFLHLPFVLIPCYLMLSKVKTLRTFVEKGLSSTSISTDDIAAVCKWFDALHTKNRVMNRVLSPLVAATFCIFGPLEVFMILSLFDSRRSGVEPSSVISWILLNAFVLINIAICVGDLEAQSQRYKLILFTIILLSVF